MDDNLVTLNGLRLLKCGLEKNRVLRSWPFPVLDVTEALRLEKSSELQKEVQRLAYEIGNIVAQNAAVSQQPSSIPVIVVEHTPVAPSTETTFSEPPATALNAAQHILKRNSRRINRISMAVRHARPEGIDTKRASALFSELETYIGVQSEEKEEGDTRKIPEGK